VIKTGKDLSSDEFNRNVDGFADHNLCCLTWHTTTRGQGLLLFLSVAQATGAVSFGALRARGVVHSHDCTSMLERCSRP